MTFFDSYRTLSDSGDAGKWRIEDTPEGQAANFRRKDMKRQPFKKGDQLVCMVDSGYTFLTEGRVYTAVSDEEGGIFSDRPFITVVGDNESPVACHASRFSLHDGEEVTPDKLERIREERRKPISRGAHL